MTAYTVAIDLGGTHVRAALVSADGVLLAHDRRTTPRDEPTPAVIPAMIRKVLAVGATGRSDLAPKTDSSADPGTEPDTNPDTDPDRRSGIEAGCRAVIGVPGVIDHEEGRLLAAPNLPPSWIGYLNEEWLQAETGLPSAMANDADLAAVGESTFGAGKGHRDVAYVTISTGVGAGVVVADQLVRAALSGGELGHTVIDRIAAAAGRPCTVEDLGSGTAIEAAARTAGITARGPALADLVRAGDADATAVWNNAIEAVGLGIANLAWIVAPNIVVVGGGVGMNGDLVIPILKQQLERFGPETGEVIEVATAALGDQAALCGAAAWWKAVGRG